MKRFLRSKLFLTLAAFVMIAAAIVGSLSGHIPHSHATAPSSPSVIATIPVSNEPTGIAVNPNFNRIYVGHGGSEIAVIDGATNTVLTTITAGNNHINMAVNPTTNFVYATNQAENTISVIDGGTNAVVATVPVGNAPHGIAVNPVTNTIYVGNRIDSTVSVIDGASNTVTTTIPLPAIGLHSIAVNTITNTIYVTQPDSDVVSVIDGANYTVSTISLPAGSIPIGIGVNEQTNRIYVGNGSSNNVTVIDSTSNTVIATIPAGTKTNGIAVNPTTNRIYAANSISNTVSIIDGATNTVVATVPVGMESIFLGADPKTNRVYVSNQADDTVSVIQDIDTAIDTTPPAIHCGTADGQWHASDVSIACTASDPESGLANPADANFSLSTNVANGSETANALTGTHQVCDQAGNCATAGPISGNMVDKKAPNITITTPTNNATYTYQQTVTAAYSCADGGSGVATCSGSVPNGSNVDTASVGWKTFSVTATDNVANTASQALSYAVKYDWSGALQPINADGSSIFKLGSTVPVKFQLTSASAGVSNAVVKLYIVKINNNVEGTVQEAISTAAADSGNIFRYDSISQQYIFNLSTKGLTIGTYALKFYVGGDNTTGVLQGQVTISLR